MQTRGSNELLISPLRASAAEIEERPASLPETQNHGAEAETSANGASPAAHVPDPSQVPTPLELPGWVAFTTWRTGLREQRFSEVQGGAGVRAVFYVDRRGRLRLPLENPYMPVVFHSNRQRRSGQTAQWLQLATPLVEEMLQRGVANQLILPPDVNDVRPWQWRGFLVGVRYTYRVDFPDDLCAASRETRRLSERAAKMGMTVDRVPDVEAVIECLRDTEARQHFAYELDARALRVAQTLLGPDSLRLYVCFDPDGRPAATHVVIHAPGARAISWIAGTRTADLSSGASMLVWRRSLEDLCAAGATGIDLCGANFTSVAMFKSQFGGRLVPTYGVRTYSLRAGARFLSNWLASRRSRTASEPRGDGADRTT